MANATGSQPDTLLSEILDAAIRGARRIAFAHGWRRSTLAVCGGVLTAFALVPFHVIPGVLLGITLLIWLIDGLDEGWTGAFEAFLTGTAFGVGYFSVAFYGLWLTDLDGLVLIAWASLFPAIAVLIAHQVWTVGPERGLTLAIVLSGAEWCRAHVFGGLPLALVGSVWAEIPPMLQITAWVGVYGLSLITLAGASAIAGGLPNPSFTGHGRAKLAPFSLWWPAATLGTLLLVFLIGLWRLPGEVADPANQTYVRIVIAQKGVCDIDPADLQRKSSLPNTSLNYSEISMLIVPGRSCGPGFLSEQPGGTEMVAAWIHKNQVAVVQSARRARPRGIYDALHVIDSDGQIRATYDRTQRLPFGLGLDHPVYPEVPIIPGTGPRTYAPSDVPEFSLLVGIDVAASGAVVDRAKRPAWLLSLSDQQDAVPGTQKQFEDAARLRAVEEGVPVVHATAGGLSVVFDAYGRHVMGSDTQQSSVMDAPLPPPLPATLYAQAGSLAVFLVLLIASGLTLAMSRRRLPSIRAA